jgi:DNA gyrase inhibitor GyrI
VVFNDARTGMPPGIPGGAMCVQRFDDSLNSAIHTTYRISLRSSSMREPRDPLLKVLTFVINSIQTDDMEMQEFNVYLP